MFILLLKLLSFEQTAEILTNLIPNFQFLDGEKIHVEHALRMNVHDIEDAIYYQIAFGNHMDAIITSDKDFLKLSKDYLPVITPEELIDKLRG